MASVMSVNIVKCFREFSQIFGANTSPIALKICLMTVAFRFSRPMVANLHRQFIFILVLHNLNRLAINKTSCFTDIFYVSRPRMVMLIETLPQIDCYVSVCNIWYLRSIINIGLQIVGRKLGKRHHFGDHVHCDWMRLMSLSCASFDLCLVLVSKPMIINHERHNLVHDGVSTDFNIANISDCFFLFG